MTIEKFIEKLKNWNPSEEFQSLTTPVRKEKGKIKNPEVISIINIYGNKYAMYRMKEIKEEYVEYEYDEGKTYIKDNEWLGNAEIKCKNLQMYLNKMKMLESNSFRLFIGEAPGIKGCFGTGIPFTDERILVCERLINKKNQINLENSFFNELRNKSNDSCKNSQKERTSYIVWERLNRINKVDLPILWNIYPFHPGQETERKIKNRPPTPDECKKGIDFLFDLLEFFDIKEIYPVGDKARETLEKSKEDLLLKKKFSNIKLKLEECEYIPHPSYKGAQKFRERLSQIYPELKNS